MPNVQFLGNTMHDKLSNTVSFPALVDGRAIACAISYEAMRDHFGADYYDPVPAFMAHQSIIHQLAEKLISEGRFEGDNKRIVIRSQDVTNFLKTRGR